ncbi:hypothetical protein [Methanosarcina sp.]|nr:hypothetical protein [Methanosarcina sp.]MDW5550518.1 hypothetical protein [Methanosarcina sp.]MDW5554222.1 hypothetical protein [Methanosarcina sp.]MDW5559582.1 hypothetical protein [Methanosarcina sp.]
MMLIIHSIVMQTFVIISKAVHVIYPPYDAAISEEGKVEHYM